MEKFQVRKRFQGEWKRKEEKEEGGNLDGMVVMQNPDIVFLSAEEMRAMGLVAS